MIRGFMTRNVKEVKTKQRVMPMICYLPFRASEWSEWMELATADQAASRPLSTASWSVITRYCWGVGRWSKWPTLTKPGDRWWPRSREWLTVVRGRCVFLMFFFFSFVSSLTSRASEERKHLFAPRAHHSLFFSILFFSPCPHRPKPRTRNAPVPKILSLHCTKLVGIL